MKITQSQWKLFVKYQVAQSLRIYSNFSIKLNDLYPLIKGEFFKETHQKIFSAMAEENKYQIV